MALPRGLRAMVTRLGQESSFIFDGTIEREEASSVSIIPAGPGTATVRVGHVHLAQGDLDDQAGQQVTVVFPAGNGNGSAAPGSRRLFFTDPFVYGETVGVRALDTVDLPSDEEALRALITEIEVKADEDRLREHLATAEMVVDGVVVDRYPVDDPSPLSEHRPDWHVAVVETELVLKGEELEADIRVRYPGSTDVRWYLTPKPEVGEHAIFVLHRDGLEIGDTGLAILHEDDVIPSDSDALERHQRLI